MIRDCNKWFARGLDWCLASLILSVTAIALAQVVLRYTFSAAILWAEEVSVILMVWFVAFGAARAWLSDEHISVNLLPDVLPSKARLALLLTFDGLAIAAGVSLVVISRPLVAVYESIMLDTVDATAWWKYTPLIVAGILLALAGSLRSARRISDA
ncbi:TRAP transporter small permease subunit [Lentibacter algarum]|uniref:TRAP transporter small permease n=1 Tax=Lentibacter algarum TaxID=576131 RepID=UPI001C093360|nr:TRAP transporter small permease subunit [Lentibacter algarum]MBU2982820.1 TRAP transporter small permease subunit [Lentibacter algarum]